MIGCRVAHAVGRPSARRARRCRDDWNWLQELEGLGRRGVGASPAPPLAGEGAVQVMGAEEEEDERVEEKQEEDEKEDQEAEVQVAGIGKKKTEKSSNE